MLLEFILPPILDPPILDVFIEDFEPPLTFYNSLSSLILSIFC